MYQFVCYTKCSTCAKAEKWLKANQVEYEKRDIKTKNPAKEELREWQSLSGVPLKKFFNTSGQLYRSMNLKEKLKDMSDEEMLELLASDGMLVKRPVLSNGKTVLVGFKEADWNQIL